jgi:hypothetical protein
MADSESSFESLTPEQLLERCRDLQHEVTYWQQVLGDCGKVGDELLVVTEQLLASTVSAGVLIAGDDELGRRMAGQVLEANSLAMPKVLGVLRLVEGLIELANGRGLALDRTLAAIADRLGIERDDDDEVDEP